MCKDRTALPNQKLKFLSRIIERQFFTEKRAIGLKIVVEVTKDLLIYSFTTSQLGWRFFVSVQSTKHFTSLISMTPLVQFIENELGVKSRLFRFVRCGQNCWWSKVREYLHLTEKLSLRFGQPKLCCKKYFLNEEFDWMLVISWWWKTDSNAFSEWNISMIFCWNVCSPPQ